MKKTYQNIINKNSNIDNKMKIIQIIKKRNNLMI